MIFKKVDEPQRRAEKLSKTGALYYTLWSDEGGNEYVRMEGNYGGGGAGTGSFSEDFYCVEDIGLGDTIVGYDTRTEAPRITNDNNMSAFLRAVRADVLERRERDKALLAKAADDVPTSQNEKDVAN